MIPVGCFLDTLCRYRCGLCFWYKSDDLSDIQEHLPAEANAYCKNGMRCVGDNQFECICGDQFTKKPDREYSQSAASHVDESKCMNSRKSFCHKCEVQLESLAALKRHIETKRHKDTEGPIFKDLYCKTCDIQCHTQKQMKSHLETKKHKQTLEHGKNDLNCSVCGITCQGQKQMLAHLETKKHKKLLANQTAQMGEHITGTA